MDSVTPPLSYASRGAGQSGLSRRQAVVTTRLERRVAEITNLNKVRKARANASAQAAAAENRVRFGRTKAEREAEKARAEKAKQALDQARRDPD